MSVNPYNAHNAIMSPKAPNNRSIRMVELGVNDIRRVTTHVLKHLDPSSIESISDAIAESVDVLKMKFVAIQAYLEPSAEEVENAKLASLHDTESVVASAYLLEYPGQLASLVGPSLASDPGLGIHSEAAKAVLEALIRRARDWRVELVQAVIDDESPFPTDSLREAGLLKLSSLYQMAVDLPSNVASSDPGLSGLLATLNWQQYSPADKKVWIDWMDATYEQTADCPELNGLRTTSKTLEGYLASAGMSEADISVPEWWAGFEVEQEASAGAGKAKIATAFMLSDTGGRHWELSYMGVAPAHRGRGLGNATLFRALGRVQELQARRLTLAVDCRNSFAIRLYREYGFQRVRQLEAWFLAFRN
jgi:mycothiol synthase